MVTPLFVLISIDVSVLLDQAKLSPYVRAVEGAQITAR